MKRKRLVGIILSFVVVICMIAEPMVAFAGALTSTVDNSVDKSTTRIMGVLKLTGCTGSDDSFESGLTVYDSEKVKVDYSNPTNDYIQSLIDAAKEKAERLGQTVMDGYSGSCTLKPAATEKSESSYDNRVYTWVKDEESDDGILVGDPDSGAVGNQNRHMVITGDYARTTTYTVTVEVVFPDHVWDDGLVTKEATDTEEGIRMFTCAGCRKTKTEIIPKLNDEQAGYKIIAGANTEWKKGGTTGISFISDAPFDKFDSVKVDSSFVEATNYNYTAESGSTKITLDSAYLETLSVGTHSIEIISNDGNASTNFTVNCTCKCHKDRPGFIWNLQMFFWKLFKIKKHQICECGVAHW